MNKQSVVRIVVVFAGMEIAGLCLAILGLDLGAASARLLTSAVGAAIFAAGLAFVLVSADAVTDPARRLPRAGVIFAGLAAAGVAMAAAASRLPASDVQGVLILFGSSLLGGGLAFLLIEAFNTATAHAA